MVNAVYPAAKERALGAGLGLQSSPDLRAILVDLADYTYNAAHDFLDDVPAIARVATSATIGSVTIAGGLVDAADFVFPTVSGDPSEAIIFYLHTGVEATSRLLFYFDTSIAGIPVTPNGQNINVTLNASGIWQMN